MGHHTRPPSTAAPMGLWWTCCIALAWCVRASHTLQSNSLTTCGNGESHVEVDTFHVEYGCTTNAVAFDVRGEGEISTDVEVTILVTAYGELAFERTFAPCDLHMTQLCPILAGPSQASGNLSLPTAVTSQDSIHRLYHSRSTGQCKAGVEETGNE